MAAPIVPALPIFPLPDVVLLPGELLPLHVFEPRYRALVAACLAEDRLIGIATLRPGYERDDERRPAVWPELGMGRIAQHRALPDGRSNILVAFVAAGLIEAEHPSIEPFRRVRFAPFESVEHGVEGVSRLRVLAVQALARAGVEGADEALRGSSEVWMDALARMVLVTSADRRAWLRARAHADRVVILEGALVAMLARGVAATEA
ncbi:MAG TPA: LON peptidase substrate-binding domain-containing protein [Myxococcota bacterium]|nr:LON peptidase substrate-binding domain-containing protein [Myxococcota bacterium]